MDTVMDDLDHAMCPRCVKTGDIIAFTTAKTGTSKHLFSYVVRLFTMSEYSHVGIAYVVEGRLFVLEAQIPEVRITPMSKQSRYYVIPMNTKVNSYAIDMLLCKIGEKYSMMEAVLSYFGFNDIKNRSWICTEYVQYYLDLIGIKTSNIRTPSDVVSILLEKYNKSLIYVGPVSDSNQ